MTNEQLSTASSEHARLPRDQKLGGVPGDPVQEGTPHRSTPHSLPWPSHASALEGRTREKKI